MKATSKSTAESWSIVIMGILIALTSGFTQLSAHSTLPKPPEQVHQVSTSEPVSHQAVAVLQHAKRDRKPASKTTIRNRN